MSEPLAVLRVGMRCPVGLDAAQTTSAIRAGVTRKSATPLRDSKGRRVVLGHLAEQHLATLAAGLADRAGLAGIHTRMLRLAGPPLAELLSQQFASVALPLYLAGPQLPADFVSMLATQAKARIELPASRVFELGGAGLFAAIVAARDELLTPGHARFVVVGGVDSFYDPERLAGLERDARLRTSGPQDAFTPGEGAGFMILATQATCRRYSFTPLAWITEVAVADAASQRRPTEGLAAACTLVLDGSAAPPQPIRLVMAGLNGESKSASEWGIAAIRNREHFADDLQIEHPAEFIGDAGAALAPLMLGIAALQLRAHLVSGPALVWACSDTGHRGALVLYAGA